MIARKMYKGLDEELYGDIEETILACLLIEPKLINNLKVEEKHFKRFDYILTFFKKFYEKYECLDITLMLSVLKNGSQLKLLDTITYLTEIFALTSHFEEYQNRLLERYKEDKKEQWLRQKIYARATELYVGNIDLKEFYLELKKLNENANRIEWK